MPDASLFNDPPRTPRKHVVKLASPYSHFTTLQYDVQAEEMKRWATWCPMLIDKLSLNVYYRIAGELSVMESDPCVNPSYCNLAPHFWHV